MEPGSSGNENVLWRLADELRDSGHRSSLWGVLALAKKEGLQLNWQDMILLQHRFPRDGDPGFGRAVYDFVRSYVADKRFRSIIDPSAGTGILLSSAVEANQPERAVGIVRSPDQLAAAEMIGRNLPIRWQFNDASKLDETSEMFDLVVSFPPFGTPNETVQIRDRSDVWLEFRVPKMLKDVLQACANLSEEGEALLLLTEGDVTLPQKAVLPALARLGLWPDAFLSLSPSQVIATSTPLNLVRFRRQQPKRSFVGRISDDAEPNRILLDNLKAMRPGVELPLGRVIQPGCYTGYAALEAEQLAKRLSTGRGLQAIALTDIAKHINLVKHGAEPGFEEYANSVYLPIIGRGPAVTALADLRMKPQNYVQLVLNEQRAVAPYVAEFFSSPLGLAVREQHLSGFIPKLTKRALQDMRVFLPPVSTQLSAISLSTRIRLARAQLEEIHDRLWEKPTDINSVQQSLRKIISEPDEDSQFVDWLDSLPFPLAIILWLYHSSADRPKEQRDHLLNFFEALSEFLAVTLMSGFKSQPEIGNQELRCIKDALEKQHLGLDRATVGTWSVIYQRLSKAVRECLRTGAANDIAQLRSMFGHSDNQVYEMLSDLRLVQVMQNANNYRNNWRGHSGVVDDKRSAEQCDILFALVTTVREVFGESWRRYPLVIPGSAKYARGLYNYSVHLVMGSRFPFGQRCVTLTHPLDDHQLYLLPRMTRSVATPSVH